MHRYFVTGSDTDVGKTIVTAGLALALRRASRTPTIVKLVQTGVRAGDEGDAERAGHLAGVSFKELARYEKPADPWSAALAQRQPALRAAQLAGALLALDDPIVVEGTGGIVVPLNADESLGDVAAAAKLRAIVAVGLRLGCINHALLTLDACRRLGIEVAGAVLVERWGPTTDDYRADVARVLTGKARVLGTLPFAAAEPESVDAAAKLFESFV